MDRRAVPVLITVLVCISFGQALAQESREESAVEGDKSLPNIVVTGTRIPAVSPEHLPLSIIDREQLEATGAFRLSEALRQLPWNNLGAQSEGFNVGGRYTLGFVDLMGAGANRTLVLVNGRRLVLSPESNGEFSNINNLPMAAVERVEILRDGASSVYGSDAIGGVVNIVLRDHFEGWEAEFGFSHSDWNTDMQDYSVSGGWNGGHSQWIWSLALTRGDPIKFADALADPSDLVRNFNPTGEPGTWFLTDWFGNDTLVPGPWTADDDCPPERRSNLPPWVALNPETGLPGGPESQSLCALEFSQQHDLAAATDTDQLVLRGEWDAGQHTLWFAQLLYTRLEARATFTSGGDLPDAIAVDNPINPSWDPAQGRAHSPVTVYFGLFQLGERERRTRSKFTSALLGGVTTLPRGELEYGLQTEDDDFAQSVSNLALRSDLRNAIAAGLFNPFDSHNDPEVVDGLRYTQSNSSKTSMTSADLTWRAEWPEWFDGKHRLTTVAGLEFRQEAFRHDADPEDLALNVFGFLPGGIDTDADRNVGSAFLEAALSPGEKSQFIYSARFDKYEFPDDSETTHKLSWSWDALGALSFRASWGQGFRAPSLLELFAPLVPSLSFAVIDTLKCQSTGIPPSNPFPPLAECFPVTIPSFEAANAALKAERSVNWNAGIVWRPAEGLRLEIDYWNLEIDDRITTPSAQETLNLEAAGALPAGSSVLRDAGGWAREVTRGRINVPEANLSGIDATVDWEIPGARLGIFNVYSWWSFLETYEIQTLPEAPVIDRVGGADSPRWKSQSGMRWSRDALTADLTINGVAEFGDPGFPLAEWWSYDLQGTLSLDWGGEVVLGVRNLTDRQPENINFRHHDYGGRTWYMRYRQTF